jgi:hypothetical protein
VSSINAVTTQGFSDSSHSLAVVRVFCKKAMAGIRPVLIKNPAAAAFALRNKAEMYEAERLRRVRLGLTTSPDAFVFTAASCDEDCLVFDLRIPSSASKQTLLPAGSVTITFQQMLEFSGFPTVKA